MTDTTTSTAPSPGPAGAARVRPGRPRRAISDNVAALKALAGDAEVMAVVKADAYGHGLVPSARAALRGGATWLGVAQLPEALELRRAGVDGAAALVAARAGPGLRRGRRRWASTSASPRPGRSTRCSPRPRRPGRTARVHLKVDTGLGRNGAWDADLAALLATAGRGAGRAAPSRSSGCSATSPTPTRPQHPTVRAQQERFEGIVAQAERAGDRARRCATSPTPRPR